MLFILLKILFWSVYIICFLFKNLFLFFVFSIPHKYKNNMVESEWRYLKK